MDKTPGKPRLYALDLESTLAPEIWIAVATSFGVPELRLTTRDVPDYAALMRKRMEVTRREGITIAKIRDAIGAIDPLPGARDFLDALRAENPALILSDTYYQIAMPLVAKLGFPALYCHTLSVDEDGFITDFHLRAGGSKKDVVEAHKALGFEVYAIGDSHNDTGMLEAADKGFFIHAPENIAAQFPQFPTFNSYSDLQKAVMQ